MGGIGSGRIRERALITGKLYIDALQMARNGWVKKLDKHFLSFSKGDKTYAQLGIIADEKQVQIVYQSKNREGTLIDEHHVIEVEATPCRFGGVRYWFICPFCGRKVVRVYLSGHWQCRKCAGLAYPAENESVRERKYRKVDKLRSKLGKDLNTKPKGMHWRTYWRLMLQYQQTRAQAASLMLEHLHWENVTGMEQS